MEKIRQDVGHSDSSLGLKIETNIFRQCTIQE